MSDHVEWVHPADLSMYSDFDLMHELERRGKVGVLKSEKSVNLTKWGDGIEPRQRLAENTCNDLARATMRLLLENRCFHFDRVTVLHGPEEVSVFRSTLCVVAPEKKGIKLDGCDHE